MAKRKGSPLLPNWPDAISIDDVDDIRAHWAAAVAEYEKRVASGDTFWERHLRDVRELHALWVDLVARRKRGEKITPLVRNYLREH